MKTLTYIWLALVLGLVAYQCPMAQSTGKKIIVRDELGSRVDFTLVGQSSNVRLDSQNGVLEVDQVFLGLHPTEKWTIEFRERLAEIVYYKRFYVSNNSIAQYVRSGNIELPPLFASAETNYYLMKRVRELEPLEKDSVNK